MSHAPGRGHRRKSDPIKKKRVRSRAARKRAKAQEVYEEAKKRWTAMTDEQRQLLPELDPDNFAV